MSAPFQNKYNNTPMCGEESHLEILTPEIIPKGAKLSAGLAATNDQKPPLSIYPDAHKNNSDLFNPPIDFESMPDFEIPQFLSGIGTERYENVFVPRVPIVSKRWTDADNLADYAKAPNYLINRHLETDAHGMLSGASMAFKTFVALDMAHSVCTGNDFMGNKVYQSGRVLYICGEGHGALSRRIKAKKIVSGDFNGNLFVMNVSTRIDNPVDMAQLKKDIEEINPVLVIFDTFASLVGNTDENNPSDVGRTLRLIKETCKNGFTSSITVHHTGKDASKGMRGASNFTNDVDFTMELNRQADSMITTLSCGKMKDGEEFPPISMNARVVELGLTRQDGTDATSLVLSLSDYVPTKKSKSLSNEESKVLTALKTAIENDGVSPPKSIINLYPDNPENVPTRTVLIESWRVLVYDVISPVSTPDKMQAAKKSAFRRAREKLENLGLIGFHGGYVWAIDRNNHII